MDDKLYEALERFSIMSENEDVSDRDAIIYVGRKYGKDIARKIWDKYVVKG